MHNYTPRQEAANNIPYALMTMLGAFIVWDGLPGPGLWRAAGALLFGLYGVGGAFWMMYFICPHCGYHGTRGCNCGFGRISGLMRGKQPAALFARQFRKHIGVIVPIWFLPAGLGAYRLWRGFDWTAAILLALFVVNSFVVLPWLSSRKNCAECPQRGDCPWRGKTCR